MNMVDKAFNKSKNFSVRFAFSTFCNLYELFPALFGGIYMYVACVAKFIGS